MSDQTPQARTDRALYKRLVITYYDITETRCFLNRLLGLNGERVPEPSDRIQRDALMTALIVGYVRPFSANKSGDTIPCLSDLFLRNLTPSQRKLHDDLLDLRNQQFAHSDPVPPQVKVTVRQSPIGTSIPWPISNRTRIGLDEAQLRDLNAIFTHLLGQVFEEMTRIEVTLTYGDTF